VAAHAIELSQDRNVGNCETSKPPNDGEDRWVPEAEGLQVEPQEPESTPFRFHDPAQEWIHTKLLHLVGPGPAAFYRDACWLMIQSPPLASTSHLVGHLVREIDSAICDVLEPTVKRWQNARPSGSSGEDGDKSVEHRTKIRANLGYLGISESEPVARAWLRLGKKGDDYSLHRLAHRRGASEPRPVDQSFLSFWEEIQNVHAVVLDRFEANYASVFDTLDRILAKSRPSHEDLKQLRTNVPDNIVTWSYFFEKLSSADWLMPLRDAGFFDHPPEVQLDGERTAIGALAWPQSRYLARVASTSPFYVLGIMHRVSETGNQFVHSDLIDAALAMPSDLAAEFAKKEAGWLDTHESIDLLLPQKPGELVEYLAREKQIDAALTLAKSLLQLLPPRNEERHVAISEPRARFDTWNYGQILKTQIPTLAAMAGEKAVVMLCDLLESAVQLYRKGLGPEDYSHFWREAVEASDEDQLSDPKELLVSAIRDAVVSIGRIDQSRPPSIIQELEKHKWFIFQRLSLHVLNTFPKGNEALIAERLTNRAIFTEPALWHEYSLLAQNQFGNLSLENQNKILNWINEGPDASDLAAIEKEQTEKIPAKEETQHYVKHWQLLHLAPIRASLPDPWKSRYKELANEFGEPEHPEFLTRHVAVFGPASPKKAIELEKLSVGDVVRYLREWRPSGSLLAPSPEGLSRELTIVVSSDPTRFASAANLFRELHPTYVRGMLSGLTEAAEKGHSFEWATVLDLCQWIVRQPRAEVGEERIDLEFDVGWAQARKSIARLLSKGFQSKAGEIPYDLRKIAWNVIEPLTKDPDPTTESERNSYDPQSLDPINVGINTIRGEAIRAVLCYSLWVRRHLDKGSKEVGFESMSETQEVLDAHLDPNIENTLAIRAIYGQHLPWLFFLDKRWALSRLSKILPSDESLRDSHDAAWGAYIVYCPPYGDIFEALREEYASAVEGLGDGMSKWRYLGADPKERLAEHLMVLYWHGILDLEERIMRRFFEIAPDELRAHALSFVGRELLNEKGQIPITTVQRLRLLWESRNHAVQSSPSSNVAELSAFGWWFASAKFEDAWALAQLSTILSIAKSIEAEHQVLKRLSILASEFPEQAIDCLSLMATYERAPWTFVVWREEIRAIMVSAIKSNSKNAAKKTAVLINRLSAIGRLEFRDLLNAGQ